MAVLPAQLPTTWLCLAVVGFLLKHWIADFILQTHWMAHGKEAKENWLLPLMVHAAIHAVGTLGLCVALVPALWWIAPVDLVIHALFDRGKGLVSRHYEATPSKSVFWRLLGIDQTLHGLTHLLFALWIAAAHVPT